MTRLNDWGRNEYTLHEGWDSYPEDESEFDFDLARWISAGKLFWIAPKDNTLTLRGEVSGCPYIALKGRQTITRVQNGEVWW
jgi:hypothetical protein